MQKNKAKLIFGGALIGLTNGLLGGGGGMLAVPLLQRSAQLSSQQAHATAIAVILPASAISAIIYLINGFLSLSVFLPVALGVLFGGLLGAKLLARLSAQKITFIFSLLMLAAGIRMVL